MTPSGLTLEVGFLAVRCPICRLERLCDGHTRRAMDRCASCMGPEETDRRIVKPCSRPGSPVNYFPLGCSGKLPSSPLLIFGKSTMSPAGRSRCFAGAGQSKVSFPIVSRVSIGSNGRIVYVSSCTGHGTEFPTCISLFRGCGNRVYVRQSVSEHGDDVTNIPIYPTSPEPLTRQRPSSRPICQRSCQLWPVITSQRLVSLHPSKSSNPDSTSQKIDPPCPAR